MQTPLISIIIPVYQEADIILETLDTIESLDHRSNTEIILVDGDPQGSTMCLVKNYPVRAITAPKGRASQMNAGARLAGGEILLFLHADTCLPKDGLKRIEDRLKNPDISAGAFDLGIRADGFAFRLIEQMVFWRSRITRIPYGDQAIFIRHSIFNALGGYRQIPIMEDIDLIKRVKRTGYRIAIIDSQIWTSARRWEKEGIIACTLRNWLLSSAFYLGVAPEKLQKFYH